MVRTKADSSSVKGQQNTGGNPHFPRETPSWQKEITHFLKSAAVESENKSEAPSTESSREMSMEDQEDSSTKDAAQS